MKHHIKRIIPILLFLLFFVSCSDSLREDIGCNIHKKTSQIILENHVTYGNIVTLNKGMNSVTRSCSDCPFSVDCITSDDNDTLLYICSKRGGGWTIYSSDARVPAIIAESDQGSYEDLMQNKNAKAWIQAMAEDIRVIKTLDDEELNFTKEEIENNKSFWKSISSPDEYVKERQGQSTTRAIHPHGDFIPAGHYEYSHSISYSEVYDFIPRLTHTNWHQDFPYNFYCPYKTTGNGIFDHAPAGCVAIAGAEMLYFLHDHFGVPATAPSEAYCNSNIDDFPNYDWAQYNYNHGVWGQMNDDGTKAAPLVADIGRRVNMRYRNESSSAGLFDLVDNVFLPYGICCTYSDYNTSYLKSTLLSGIPVLLGAQSINQEKPSQTSSHAFIIDRYKRTRIVTENWYEWVWDYTPPNGGPLPLVPEEIVYTYSSPVISMIGMNWGWGYWYNSFDEWYALTGDWIPGSLNQYNYNISRKMIYNFHVVIN